MEVCLMTAADMYFGMNVPRCLYCVNRYVVLTRVTAMHTLAIVIILFSVAAIEGVGEAALGSVDYGASDEASTGAHRLTEKNIKHVGSKFIPSQRSERSLLLKSNTYAEVKLDAQLDARGGTISFWVYPLWQKDDRVSHTFLSQAWGKAEKSYLVITLGWWEPQGSNRLYFIVSNKEYAHCALPYQFPPKAWTMVTAVWKAGDNGYCKLFINGERIVSMALKFRGDYLSTGSLYLGSDEGTTQAQGRSADAMLEDIMIYSGPLSEGEVKVAYQAQEKDPEGADRRKWKWLDEGLAMIPLQASTTKTGEILESRVMFDEDIHWALSKDNTDKILTRLKAAGFNVYVPCVWHGNGTYYPTTLTEPAPKIAEVLATGDPLAYLIEKASLLGIEVHPWFTVSLRQGTRYPSFFGEGVPESSYDVHNQEFRKFIVDLMVDVVRRYNVAGVNLDYIRAMGLCTSNSCRTDFTRLTGTSFWADYSLRGILGPARSRLEQWQDRAVRDIVETFSNRAREIKPKLVISVDSHPKPKTEPRPLEGRDEIGWLNDGLIDVVFAMDYRERIDYETINAVRQDLRRPEGLIVLFGNYDRQNDTTVVPRKGELVAKYASYAQRQWPLSGVAFYIYGEMSDAQVKALRAGPFKDAAVPAWASSNR